MRHGVGAWSSPEWRAEAVAWLDARLADAGLRRTGPAEQPRVRPWATVLRAETSGGVVWMKAGGPGTAFEAPLYALLVRAAPEHVLHPLGVDTERGWMLLPDGGTPLADDDDPPVAGALASYGALQRRLAPHAAELLALGVQDMRPAALPERFEQALEAARPIDARLERLRPWVAEASAELAASPIPASLDHNDLHPGNMLAGGRFYDWGDSVLAHPFAAMLVPLGLARDPGHRRSLRDAYLAEFTDLAPHAELAGTLEPAIRLARIARALVWERALNAARAQGEPVDPRWAGAPRQTLMALLDD
jgi:hypothetical protein